MESTRQQKFARLMLKEMGKLFLTEGKGWYGNAFVTITGVRTTADLSIARIYLSVMGTKDRDNTVKQISDAAPKIRGMLGSRIKQQVRHIPQLEFYLDDSLDYAENIERLLREAKTNGKSAKKQDE